MTSGVRYPAGLWVTFLETLSICGSVRQAAEVSGIVRSKAYKRRERDAKFAAEWDHAVVLGAASLEDEARRRAMGVMQTVGVDKDGNEIKRTVASDVLLIFLLKGAYPEKYKERVSAEHSGPNGGPIQLSDVDRAARIAALLERARARRDGSAAPEGVVDTAAGAAD